MKETIIKGYFATQEGKIFSNKTGIIKPMAIFTRKNKYQTVQVIGCSLVHRLVASAFLGDITDMTVNHIDGNPSNNHVSNLEIVTMKQNIIHARDTGLTPQGEKHSRAKYSDEILLKALRSYKDGKSIALVAREFGISQSYLNKVKNKIYRSDLMDKA